MSPFDEDDDGELSFERNADDDHDLGPDIPTAPSVKTFDEGDDGGNFEGVSDIDQTTLRAFLACVIYANIALLCVSLGPMLWYFRGMTLVGPAVTLVGIVAGIRCYQVYREWDRNQDRDEDRDRNEDRDEDRDRDEDPDQKQDGGVDDESRSAESPQR